MQITPKISSNKVRTYADELHFYANISTPSTVHRPYF